MIRYFGGRANKLLSYSVASVSGTILAVCSCTVLPLFSGIYTRGAGIGPASVAGALRYFATLTEVPILQGLIGSGMGKGRSGAQSPQHDRDSEHYRHEENAHLRRPGGGHGRTERDAVQVTVLKPLRFSRTDPEFQIENQEEYL